MRYFATRRVLADHKAFEAGAPLSPTLTDERIEELAPALLASGAIEKRAGRDAAAPGAPPPPPAPPAEKPLGKMNKAELLAVALDEGVPSEITIDDKPVAIGDATNKQIIAAIEAVRDEAGA